LACALPQAEEDVPWSVLGVKKMRNSP
jgi:hypothetical protein